MSSTISSVRLASDSREVSLHPSQGRLGSVVVLSTFPPTQCGLATFTSALCRGFDIVGNGDVAVVEVESGPTASTDPRVINMLRPGSEWSRVSVARTINSYDTLLVQHEFGIFGGDDGQEVLDLLDDVYVPVLVTLHTVPLVPTQNQRRILEELGMRSDVLITMTKGARDRLLSLYEIEPDKVVTIPHGATVPPTRELPNGNHIKLLTWGLLGPGKGVEWVIDALAMVPELRGKVSYTIAGQTHPKVRERDGESYREMLERRCEFLGVRDMVTFDNRYRSVSSLLGLIQESHCVVLPYDSHDQITSGVLVDALVAGRPVIATQFPHAVELLSRGVGLTVPHCDAVSMAQAIRLLVQQPLMLSAMSNGTLDIAHEHS